jgi:hypothetical protein
MDSELCEFQAINSPDRTLAIVSGLCQGTGQAPWQEDANIYTDFWLLRKFFCTFAALYKKIVTTK